MGLSISGFFTLVGLLSGVLAAGFINVATQNAAEGFFARMRAHYNPKTIQLDAETEERPSAPSANVIESLFTPCKTQSWPQGLSRGICPSLIIAFLKRAISFLFTRFNGGRYTWTSFILRTCLEEFVTCPFRVVVYRAMTTPEKLSCFGVKRAMHVLLSPSERRRPWLIYLAPGIILIAIFNAAYTVVVLPAIMWSIKRFSDESFCHVASPKDLAHFVNAMMTTAIRTPLDLMFVRLAIQRNYNPISMPKEDLEKISSTSDQIADGLIIRPQPYAGLWDCAKCIVAEEGIWTLYRTWLYTLVWNWDRPSYTVPLILVNRVVITWLQRTHRKSLRSSPPTASGGHTQSNVEGAEGTRLDK